MRRGAKRPTRRRLAAPIAVLLGRAGLAPEPAGAPARAPKRREAGARPFAVCGSPAAPRAAARGRPPIGNRKMASVWSGERGAKRPCQVVAGLAAPSLSLRQDCFLGVGLSSVLGEKKAREGALGAVSSESFRRRPGGGLGRRVAGRARFVANAAFFPSSMRDGRDFVL